MSCTICVWCVVSAYRGQRRASESLELELQMDMTSHGGAETQTQVLWKGSQCTINCSAISPTDSVNFWSSYFHLWNAGRWCALPWCIFVVFGSNPGPWVQVLYQLRYILAPCNPFFFKLIFFFCATVYVFNKWFYDYIRSFGRIFFLKPNFLPSFTFKPHLLTNLNFTQNSKPKTYRWVSPFHRYCLILFDIWLTHILKSVSTSKYFCQLKLSQNAILGVKGRLG